MPTRQGYVVAVAAVAAIVVGRVFGIIELYVIGAGLGLALLFGVAYVAVRLPRLGVARWVHPSMLAAGDTGSVDLDLVHGGSAPSARFLLEETIRRPNESDQLAPLGVEPLAPGERLRTGYDLATATRGVVEVGPLVAIVNDPLGVARRSVPVADVDRVIVSPRA
ncbi:MAG: hypothetical protein AAGG08_14845, partial [Actinomycetota bacterium]